MPASHRKKKKEDIKKKKRFKKALIFIILPAILILLVVKYFFAGSKHWTGEEKLSVVVKNENSISILIFDPRSDEIIQINVPPNVEIETAKNLGVWKVSALWELSEKTNNGPEFVKLTLAKSFKFPVAAWGEEGILLLSSTKKIKVLGGVLFPGNTNLTFADRVGLGIFSLRIKESAFQEIDLADTSLLSVGDLSDGSRGYVLNKTSGIERIHSYFTDGYASIQPQIGVLKVSEFDDELNQYYKSDKAFSEILAQSLEVFGVKVASIRGTDEMVGGCVVRGEADFAERLASIYGCSVQKRKAEGSFDVEFIAGREFIMGF